MEQGAKNALGVVMVGGSQKFSAWSFSQTDATAEIRGSNDRDFVSVLHTSRLRSAITPWKRGANAVETQFIHKERRANSEKLKVAQAL